MAALTTSPPLSSIHLVKKETVRSMELGSLPVSNTSGNNGKEVPIISLSMKSSPLLTSTPLLKAAAKMVVEDALMEPPRRKRKAPDCPPTKKELPKPDPLPEDEEQKKQHEVEKQRKFPWKMPCYWLELCLSNINPMIYIEFLGEF